jgi:putative ABC transport system ATP-binding protein
MNEAVIAARGLKRHYVRGIETVKALDGVDVDVHAGEILSVLGPSGSGKTTLLNLLSCMLTPTAGEITVDGRSAAGLSEEQLVEIRRGKIGFIFQKFHLIPTLTVAENVELPLLFLHRTPHRAETMAALEQVGLADRATHLPRELSGGQMQRTAIARALIVAPRVLIADEPTGNLDRANGESIWALFRKLASEKNLAVVVTTHNVALGHQADRVLTLEDGKIVA